MRNNTCILLFFVFVLNAFSPFLMPVYTVLVSIVKTANTKYFKMQNKVLNNVRSLIYIP